MIRAYRLYTGPDGNSHVVNGSVSADKVVEAESIHFNETPPHSSLEWHDAPVPQYVITLAGVLEFTTVGGETFTIHPGEVLLASTDVSGRAVPTRTFDADEAPTRRRKVQVRVPSRSSGNTSTSYFSGRISCSQSSKR